ncbi:MAG: hypothetical protein E6G47_14635 [Actinobacteria bacterium]|nr:MAG: hypothetical protein E6G47_14635 [Actinomycetota bacterium]
MVLTMPEEADSMKRMGLYDQVKSAFQDLIAPELHAIRGDIHRLDQKVDGVDARLTTKIDSGIGSLRTEVGSLRTEMSSMKGELVPHGYRHPGASRRPRSAPLVARLPRLRAELLTACYDTRP